MQSKIVWIMVQMNFHFRVKTTLKSIQSIEEIFPNVRKGNFLLLSFERMRFLETETRCQCLHLQININHFQPLLNK